MNFPRKLCGLDARATRCAPSRPCTQGERFGVEQRRWSIRSDCPRRARGVSRSRLRRGRCVSRRDDGSPAWSIAWRLGRRASARVLVARPAHGAARSIGTGGPLAQLCTTLLTRVELCTSESRFRRLNHRELSLPSRHEQREGPARHAPARGVDPAGARTMKDLLIVLCSLVIALTAPSAGATRVECHGVISSSTRRARRR